MGIHPVVGETTIHRENNLYSLSRGGGKPVGKIPEVLMTHVERRYKDRSQRFCVAACHYSPAYGTIPNGGVSAILYRAVRSASHLGAPIVRPAGPGPNRRATLLSLRPARPIVGKP